MVYALALQWPGYEHVDWHRHVRLTTSSGQVTRGQLAEVIIDYLFAFFNVSFAVTLPDSQPLGDLLSLPTLASKHRSRKSE